MPRLSTPAHLRTHGPGTGGRTVERDRKICARYAVIGSYRRVGAEFELSGERIRQIVWQHRRRRDGYKRLKPLREAFAKGI
jgi:hypothetical protein